MTVVSISFRRYNEGMDTLDCPCGKPDCKIPFGFCHCGCGKKSLINAANHSSRGWVKGQPRKYLRGHQPNDKKFSKPRPPFRYEIVDGEECVWIPLADGEWMRTEKKNEWKLADDLWHRVGKYAGKTVGTQTVFAHQIILPSPDGLWPDHKNGNGLDNRESNLRISTRSQNASNRGIGRNNTSGVIGVSARGKKWISRIMVEKKEIYLGRFDTKDEAITARINAEVKYFGEFRRCA